MSKYVYDPNVLYHAGKKGMKWGFNDGSSNGKRTANTRSNEYNQSMARNVANSLNAQSNGNTAASDKAWARAKHDENDRKASSGIGYKAAYAAGRAAKGAKHAVKMAKSSAKSIGKTATKGADWFKKKLSGSKSKSNIKVSHYTYLGH